MAALRPIYNSSSGNDVGPERTGSFSLLVDKARCCSPRLLLLAAACLVISIAPLPAQAANQATYSNPVLWGDYSDPDVIRVGTSYLLVASSFGFMPGIPILRSTDLLHWTILGHVFPRLELSPQYSMVDGNRYGRGAWAPSIRFHTHRYYVYFPTPDEGIFVSTASRPEGPWTKPVAVLAGAGYEDPCPFWDDDGQAYLIHSRLGAGPLILHRMSADGRRVLDAGTTIVQDAQALPTLEGPKLYKRNGFYYIFAPYGGVEQGAQAVLRARSIWGPYEHRTVLAQGSTAVNGPHQGGYVETPDGRGWFLHFHSAGAYGRIDHLEPVRWVNDWPVIGDAAGSSAGSEEQAGEPVMSAPAPLPTIQSTHQGPATSDEFTSSRLSPQWEWNHNPWDQHWSLKERKGFLRLYAMPALNLLDARNTLTEMGQDPAYTFTVAFDLQGMADGQQAGIAMFSNRPGSIAVAQGGEKRSLRATLDGKPVDGGAVTARNVEFRVTVANAMATYAWSQDGGRSFDTLGEATPIYFSWWKAARPAIFTFNTSTVGFGQNRSDQGYLDVDWAHYDVLPPQASGTKDRRHEPGSEASGTPKP